MKNAEVEMIRAEENLIIDLQFLLVDLIDNSGLSRSELAHRLGVSKARLSQMFKPGANLTVRTIARAVHALGTKIEVVCDGGAAQVRCIAKNNNQIAALETSKKDELAYLSSYDWACNDNPASLNAYWLSDDQEMSEMAA